MSSYPHLVQRIVKSKFNSCSSHSRSKPTSHGPRGVYKSWNDVCMQKVVKAVEEGVSIRVAADKYSVPRPSLHESLERWAFKVALVLVLTYHSRKRKSWQVSLYKWQS